MIGLACGLAASTVLAEITIRDPGTWVVDQARIIDSATRQRLETLLTELASKTTAQVKVLTVQETDNEDWFGFVQRHAELWKLGQEGKDDGALIALTVKDRKVRIHTGYGLEGALPDGWCGSAAREVAKEYFKAGQYAAGLERLTAQVAQRVAADAGVQLSSVPTMPRRGQRTLPSFCVGGGVAPFLVVMFILSALSRRQRYRGAWRGGGLFQGLLLGSVLGSMGRRSHWDGGGGGSGFGGGFGGGGSFGGGGDFGGGGGGASW